MKRILSLILCTVWILMGYGANAYPSRLRQALIKKYNCCCFFPIFTCTNNVFCQLYPNQNMCELLDAIPQELRHLPYAIYPNYRSYNNNRFIYNKRFNIFPHAILQPRTECELIYVLKILRKHNLEFSLRSGGHCFESGSLSSGYIIDLGNFNKLKIDTHKQEVYIGAGNRLGRVIQALGNLQYAIPTGTCGTNGIGGLALEGGLGFLARKFGLTCDVVKNIRLVTADLKSITVDAHNYSDLFWALRGAGAGSFGVVLGFTCKISYVPCVSFLKLSWDWNPKQVPLIVNAWQSWVTTISNDITAELDFDYLDGKRTISITAFKVGKEPFTQWIDAFSNLKPRTNLQVMRYVDAARKIGGDSSLPFLKSKSKMLFTPLPDAAITLIVDFFQELHKNNKLFSVSLQLGSAGGKLTKQNTAYFPRQAFAWFFQHIRWHEQTQELDALQTINTFYAAIAPYCSPFSYANIVDYDIPDYLNAYYGNHVDRLISIKNKYDPTNFFHWKQSIPLSR